MNISSAGTFYSIAFGRGGVRNNCNHSAYRFLDENEKVHLWVRCKSPKYFQRGNWNHTHIYRYSIHFHYYYRGHSGHQQTPNKQSNKQTLCLIYLFDIFIKVSSIHWWPNIWGKWNTMLLLTIRYVRLPLKFTIISLFRCSQPTECYIKMWWPRTEDLQPFLLSLFYLVLLRLECLPQGTLLHTVSYILIQFYK